MDKAQLLEKLNLIRPKRQWTKPFLISALVVFGLAGLVFAGASTYYYRFSDRVYPGVFVGDFHLGGMTGIELKNFAETLNNRLSKEGLDFSVRDNGSVTGTFKINTVLVGGDGTSEIIKLDSDNFVKIALHAGRERPDRWYRYFYPIILRFSGRQISAPVIADKVRINDVLADELDKYENSPHDATIRVIDPSSGAYDVITEQSGMMFDRPAIIDGLIAQLQILSFAPISVSTRVFHPDIKSNELTGKQSELAEIFAYGDLSLNFVDPQTQWRHDWNLSVAQLSRLIAPKRDQSGQIYFALDSEALKKYLSVNVSSYIDQPASNAKFTMKDGRVQEFLASQTGQALDIDRTYADIDRAFVERNYHPQTAVKTVSVSVAVVDPDLKLSSLNDLGITDVLGVGISTFKDSHSNRIKNITTAVGRLNGILIPKGEEFSALKYAGPFTAENGFLPEDIIQGDKIKKEIGGGMCQIGTTLFRMAMNSGMDITERHNHSLVVGYYSDPVNGNPGTDASLFEPFLDFKFMNDTDGYLLLQTAIDFKRQQLTFTLWGKPDGRKGWYTHPTVSKWIPPGDQKPDVESAELAPGEVKCQSAFKGAIASFLYTRITSSTEKIDRRFDSYYRPLPKMCIVGKGSATSTAVSDGAVIEAGN